MFDLLMDAGKMIIGEFAGGDSQGGEGGSAAQAAAMAKLSYATERQTAMQSSRDAMRLSGSRNRNIKEGAKEKSKYSQEIAQLLRGMQDTRVRQALIQQLARSGMIDHSALTKYRGSSVTDDTATTKKPIGFA